MTESFRKSIQARVRSELYQHDEDGAFLDLTGEEQEALERGRPDVVLGLIRRHRLRNGRTLWFMALSIPIMVVVEFLWVSWAGFSFDDGPMSTWVALGIPLLWGLFFTAYGLRVALPRIIALERARALLELIYPEEEEDSSVVLMDEDPDIAP